MHLLYGLYIIGTACALRVLYILSSSLFSPLRQIPGPFLARFTKLWYLWRVNEGDFQHDNIDLHRKYAPEGQHYASVVRLGPNSYSISAADKAVYGIASKMPKTDWYNGWRHPGKGRWTIFTERDLKMHSDLRRKFQAMYSMSSLVSYERYVDQCAQIFQTRMEELSQKDQVVDMGYWFQCYAFDVIGDITFSKRFGFLDSGEDIGGMIGALDRNMKYSTLVGVYAWTHPYLYAINEKLPRSGAAGRTFLMNFMSDRLAQRRQQRKQDGRDGEKGDVEEAGEERVEDGTPEDFLDKVLDAERDGKKGLLPYHAHMMGMSNIIAGSDTTAVSLSSVLYHLIKTPRAMKKLREEIASATDAGQCDEDRVGFKDAQNMRYLQACIKEGLRLHAATGLPLWRVVPEGGAEISGQWFPAGTEIGVNSWVPHFDEDVWGKDVKEFRPERWIEAEDEGGEQHRAMEASFMPFGLGSRTCLGRHISHLEMTKLVPQIVRRFEFELERPNKEWKTQNYWFIKPMDFRVKIKLREEKA